MSLKWKSTEECSSGCGGSSEFIQQSNGGWVELKPNGTIFTFRCESIQGDAVVLMKSDGARIEITGTECRVNGHLFYTGNFVEPGVNAGGRMQGACAVCFGENLPMNVLVPCGHVFCTTCSTNVAT